MRVFSTVSRVSLLAVVASCSLGCAPLPEREEPPVDCSAGDPYEFRVLRPFDSEENSWFPSGDDTGKVECDHPEAMQPPGEDGLCDGPRRAVATATVETLPEGPRCGGEYGLRLTARRNNDWGSLYGDFLLATETRNASEFDGVALWARAAPGTDKSVLILLNDKYTQNILDDDGNPSPGEESACVEEEVDEELGGNQNIGQVGQSGGLVPGAVPSEDACGNSYQAVLTVSERWELYLLPFESFRQEQLPNRRPEGIDRSSLRGMIIRAPKAAVLDLWIDDLGYYRKIDD